MQLIKIGTHEPSGEMKPDNVEKAKYFQDETCERCNCEFKYNNWDINGFPGGYFIFCPCCSQMTSAIKLYKNHNLL